MENATKALIIAAGMLIAIMIISLGLYLFASMSTYTSSAEQKISEDQIMQYNQVFLKYHGRNDLTVHDIVTIANYAKQCNEENGYYDDNGQNHDETQYYISVLLMSSNPLHLECNTINNKTSTKYFDNLLKSDYIEVGGITQLATYKCEVYVSSDTSRVYKVELTRNK
jgi:hypothetical protein